MRTKFLFQFLLCVLLVFGANAQDKDSSRIAVAVFIPLHIDSLFEGSVFKHPGENLPRYVMPGLDFYNGVLLAAEDLKKEGISDFDIHIYDTKKNGGLENAIAYLPTHYFSLIIASFTNTEEQKLLSDYSLKYNIPLVSATYPNEGGIEKNPLFLLANPSLKRHIATVADYCNEAISNKTNVYFVTRKGATETLIEQWFDEAINEKKKIKKLEMNDEALSRYSFSSIDTSKQNLFVLGTLNDAFSVQFAKRLDSLSSKNITVAGMPTWEAVREFHNGLKHVKITYTTAFTADKKSAKYLAVAKNYYSSFMSTPTDMVLKGYEFTYRFCNLLQTFQSDFINHISDEKYDVWNSYKFIPVTTSTGGIPDFLENQKLKFISR